jgi:hypothetical protein
MMTEFLRSMNSSSLPPGELKIKNGCPLILMWNLSPSNGLCNGSCMIILRMSERVLEVQLIGGDHNGELAFIPCISLIPMSTTDFTFKFWWQQFPIRLAFAITINWAQGQSVKHVGVDLCMPVFAHGQLYVALSWVTAKQNLKVCLPHDNIDSHLYKEIMTSSILVHSSFCLSNPSQRCTSYLYGSISSSTHLRWYIILIWVIYAADVRSCLANWLGIANMPPITLYFG